MAGHGVRAALVTAMIRALAEELKPLARDPGKFLRKLNFDLCAILKNTGSPMLTTAFYFVANWQTGAVRFANAGHPKPLLVRHARQRVEPLANDCGRGQPALGLFDDPPYQTTETTMAPGDFLMLFTDGLYEVQGVNEELYSQQRLLVDVQHLLGQPAGKLFDNLLETIRTFSNDQEFEDDVCLVGMEYAGKPPAQKNYACHRPVVPARTLSRGIFQNASSLFAENLHHLSGQNRIGPHLFMHEFFLALRDVSPAAWPDRIRHAARRSD